MNRMQAYKPKQCIIDDSGWTMESPTLCMKKSQSYCHLNYAELDLRSSESKCKEVNPLDTQTTHKSKGIV